MIVALDVQTIFAAKRDSTPSVDATQACGQILREEPLAFMHRGKTRLDFTALYIKLQDHPSHTSARAIVEGHYGDLEGRHVTGRLYENRTAYDALLRHGGNPRPAYIHALMLEHRGLYFRPESLDIGGYGAAIRFSGLIGSEKSVKPSQTFTPKP